MPGRPRICKAWFFGLAASFLLLLPILPATGQVPESAADQGAEDQPGSEAWLIKSAKGAFLHIEVSGTLQDGTPSAPRFGKAFAIAPRLLVTSQHVVGDPGEWKPKQVAAGATDDEKRIERAVRPLERKVRLWKSAGDEAVAELEDPVVLPVSPYPIDTAGIFLPSAVQKVYFNLSMCPIQPDVTYRALIDSGESPSNPRSILKPAVIDLKSRNFDPSEYGGLFVFDSDDEDAFDGKFEGHDGSPIFDADGNVVAVVSAVVSKQAGGARVLATPIQAMFPGAAALMARGPDATSGDEAGLKCSLFDTVRKINEEVSTYASWTVNVERDSNGRVDTVCFNYEGVSAKPSINDIDVKYEFYGRERKDEEIGWIRDYNDPYNYTLKLARDESRSWPFVTNKISSVGADLVLPHLKDIGGGGGIVYVRVSIYPRMKDRTIRDRKTVREFEWVVPQEELKSQTGKKNANCE